MKRNGSEIFFALMRKKCFFRLFRIDAKRRNLKRNENGTKWKQNEKEAKNAIIFASKRNKAKGKRKTPIIFASKRNEAKQKWKNAIIFASKRNGSKIFSLWCENSVFLACFRIWSETKMKLTENKAKKRLFRFALKRNEKIESETRRNEKIMEAKQSENTLY